MWMSNKMKYNVPWVPYGNISY